MVNNRQKIQLLIGIPNNRPKISKNHEQYAPPSPSGHTHTRVCAHAVMKTRVPLIETGCCDVAH